jgi:hypothetical protein
MGYSAEELDSWVAAPNDPAPAPARHRAGRGAQALAAKLASELAFVRRA